MFCLNRFQVKHLVFNANSWIYLIVVSFYCVYCLRCTAGQLVLWHLCCVFGAVESRTGS